MVMLRERWKGICVCGVDNFIGKGEGEPNNRNGGGSDDDVGRNLSPSPSWPGLVRCLIQLCLLLWNTGLSKYILSEWRSKELLQTNKIRQNKSRQRIRRDGERTGRKSTGCPQEQ